MKPIYKILHLIILLICIILQLAFIEQLTALGINIDLILVVIAGIAIFDDELYGMLLGFMAGLILDLMAGSIIGVSALMYAVDGFLIGKIARFPVQRKTLLYVLVIFVATEINLLFFSGIYYLFNLSSSWRTLEIELLSNPLCNIVMMFIIFPVLRAGKEKKEEIGFIYKDEI